MMVLQKLLGLFPRLISVTFKFNDYCTLGFLGSYESERSYKFLTVEVIDIPRALPMHCHVKQCNTMTSGVVDSKLLGKTHMCCLIPIVFGSLV